MPCNDVVSRKHRQLAPPLLPVAAAVCWLAVLGPSLLAAVVVPDPGTYVVDDAKVIVVPADKKQMEDWLQELAQKTTAQVKVLTVATTGEEDVFDFAQRQYRRWGLGTKQKSNGALIVLAVKDRKVRIHTGYGLEAVLPDSWCGSTSREVAASYFKTGQYSEGLKQLTSAVVHRVAADAGVEITGLGAMQPLVGRQQPDAQLADLLPIIVVVVIAIVIIAVMSTRRGQRIWNNYGPIIISNWGTSSDWSSSGGGFGGGGFGGGGGSFGGGGSSGGGGGGASW